MNESEKLEWSAPEYEEKERSNDWFWALGVIVVAGSIASIIFKNYFFAILLVISGFMLGFFAVKKPDLIYYELGDDGLKIKDRLYPYDKIKAFCVHTDGKHLLFLKTERLFVPIFSVPVPESFAEKIKEVMLSKNVTEEEMKPHPSEKIMERLGF